MKKISAVLAVLAVLVIPATASAHVVVTPDTAKVGERVTFSISVPNEKEVAVTGVKITVPTGLNGATPTVKPGWTITVDKTGEGETAVVKSITWTGGTIPTGQRDDFTFRGQAPSKAGDLQWKALQTYADGTAVNWNQKPTSGESDSETAGPYSVTKVADDLTGQNTAETARDDGDNTNLLPTILATAAIVISVVALVRKR
jgi:uncharacterized repeat protein (TIGR01451 family)